MAGVIALPKAVVFDFDGTIVDTETPPFLCARNEFARHGLELTLEAWQVRLGRTDLPHWTEWLERAVGTPIDRDEIRSRVLEEKNRLTATQPVREGVVALIERCHDLGVAVAVASSSQAEWVHPNLRARNLFDHFATIVTRTDRIRSKPAPDSYRHACALLGVHPGDALAIEDSPNGLLAATSAGVRCVVVPNEMTRGMELTTAEAVVNSCAEIAFARGR